MDGMSANDILEAFRDPWHVTIHAPAAFGGDRMMGMSPICFGFAEVKMARDAEFVVLDGGVPVIQSGGFMRIVTVYACQLRVTTAPMCIDEFG